MTKAQIIDNPFIPSSERINAMKELLLNDRKRKKIAVQSTVDLHVHTNYSDGYWTPTGLVLEAYQKGMKLVSLTDHDGFAGIEEAFEAIQTLKDVTNEKICFVPGIELSTEYYYGEDRKKVEIHILGYFPSLNFDHFRMYLENMGSKENAYMEAFQKNRVLRIYEMADKFNSELPKKIPLLAKLKDIQDPIISDKTVLRGLRNSLAPGRLLTSTGIFEIFYLYINGRINEIKDECFSMEYLKKLQELCARFSSAQDFMKEYFDKKEPSAKTGYIGLTQNPEWAVELILKMGGIPVLAHPAKYIEVHKDILSMLVPVGLKGVEVISDHFKEKEQLANTLDIINKEYPELVITIGSDCHGSSFDREIDYTPSNIMGMRTDFEINLATYNNIYSLLGV